MSDSGGGAAGECVGACGADDCMREDCRRCDLCGAEFDRDTEGGACDSLGDLCEECRADNRCRWGECCYSGPDTWAEYWGHK